MKIFVTTGTQLPFDRLLKIIDYWACRNPTVDIIAQTSDSSKKFEHLNLYKFLEPKEFKKILSESDVVVGHAGMGTIITCIENEIPLIIFPRLYKFNEHRNDHQMATAKKFTDYPGVHVAYNEEELLSLLMQSHKLEKPINITSENRQRLIDFLFININ